MYAAQAFSRRLVRSLAWISILLLGLWSSHGLSHAGVPTGVAEPSIVVGASHHAVPPSVGHALVPNETVESEPLHPSMAASLAAQRDGLLAPGVACPVSGPAGARNVKGFDSCGPPGIGQA